MNNSPTTYTSGIRHLVECTKALWSYVSTGIWSDTRRSWWLNVIRTINLSIKSFLNRDIQTQACAMTYRTMLAIVPALALLLAIGRGFGMQAVLKEELYKLFPAQATAIKYAMNFVDSYLEQASGGLFLGVGIVFLIYTLISLLGNVEDTFNFIWGQKAGRSFWRKISDYTAMMLILPILMLCSSGISILLSSTLNTIFKFEFLTPLISIMLESAKVLMTFLFFTAVYILIPNTKVKFINAFISGIIAGTGFLILQWLFITGTVYVTKYNAIYGSFAFLPLMLLWLQLVWVICLAGAVICYSSQNVFAFNLDREVSGISKRYEGQVTLAIAALVTRRFIDEKAPATARDLMNYYDFPARLVTDITDQLCAAAIFNRVLIPGEKEVYGFQLAVDPSSFTVKTLTEKLYTLGVSNFIPQFGQRFDHIVSAYNQIEHKFSDIAGDILISSLLISDDVDSQQLKHKSSR